MKFQRRLVLLLWLCCLLGNAACLGRQVEEGGGSPAAGLESQDTVVEPESDTKEYINDWTFPIAEDSGKPSALGDSKENRERMMSDETDSYIRAWTFPTSSDESPEKSSATSKERRRQLPAEPDDTDEYIRGWTFE